MRFDRYTATGELAEYVRYLAISEAIDSSPYKVLPDTALVLGFQYKGNLSGINNGVEHRLATAGITGLADTYKTFKNSDHIGTVLVYFTETGAAAFFSHPMNELFARSLALDELIDRSMVREVEEKLSIAQNDTERINVVQQFLLAQLRSPHTDPLVVAAVRHIKAAQGNIRISHLSKSLHISQSPLEKRFRVIVGTSPKKFASIVRMRAVIHAAGQNKKRSDIGYEAGYYDQAHFIKDFKRFTGDTPENFFKATE